MTWSRKKCKSSSICLLRACYIGFATKALTLTLSHQIIGESWSLKPSSVKSEIQPFYLSCSVSQSSILKLSAWTRYNFLFARGPWNQGISKITCPPSNTGHPHLLPNLRLYKFINIVHGVIWYVKLNPLSFSNIWKFS